MADAKKYFVNAILEHTKHQHYIQVYGNLLEQYLGKIKMSLTREQLKVNRSYVDQINQGLKITAIGEKSVLYRHYGDKNGDHEKVYLIDFALSDWSLQKKKIKFERWINIYIDLIFSTHSKKEDADKEADEFKYRIACEHFVREYEVDDE